MANLKLFLDTNIIIDLLADRIPYSNSAYSIFKGAKSNKWALYTSSNSIITTFYILEKQLDSNKANRAIETILKRLEIIDLNKAELLQALKSKTADLEDASQIECATKIKNVAFIVTRDKKGFKHSTIDVLDAEEFLITEME